MSTEENFSRAPAIRDSHPDRVKTSAGTASHCTPNFWISNLVLAKSGLSGRSFKIMLAPDFANSIAHALPIPRPDPVIKAVFLLKSICMV